MAHQDCIRHSCCGRHRGSNRPLVEAKRGVQGGRLAVQHRAIESVDQSRSVLHSAAVQKGKGARSTRDLVTHHADLGR